LHLERGDGTDDARGELKLPRNDATRIDRWLERASLYLRA
jgi:hypothetical protein